MSKAELEAEIRRLKSVVSAQKQQIKQLGDLNRKAFKMQHEAEQKLNALYASRQVINEN